jgi:hypothetical protein
MSDLLLGVRLALSAGRAGWARLVLAIVGTAAAVVVLLFAASARHAYDAASDRSDRLVPSTAPAPAGMDPVIVEYANDEFHNKLITVVYIGGRGAHPVLPPGVSRLPGPGEAVVSPALAKAMSGSAGELLRARYPQTVIGRIGKAGLEGPQDRRIYLAGPDTAGDRHLQVGAWGGSYGHREVPSLLWALLLIGVVVLLFPVFVFVATSSRLADAERDRRLGALRLIGASAAQVRRVAAGESLLSAGLGLVLGGGVFVLARPLARGTLVPSVAAFTSDIVPAWQLVVVIGAAVPALAVGSALFALRHTVIEPLGVVRRSGPPRRRLWWRLLPAVAGAAVLLYLLRPEVDREHSRPAAALVAGVVLLLFGIPTVLPWLVQQVVRRPRDETVALQLATRRLLLDSGTPARVMSGIGVVLAGAIGLSSLLLASEQRYGGNDGLAPGHAYAQIDDGQAALAERFVTDVRGLPGVSAAYPLRSIEAAIGDGQVVLFRVGDCAALRVLAVLPTCVDGQVFIDDGAPIRPGQRVRVAGSDQPGSTGAADDASSGTPWVVPATATVATRAPGVIDYVQLLATPAAVAGLPATLGGTTVDIRYDPDGDAVERIRNAAAPLRWHGTLATADNVFVVGDRHLYQSIRRGLLAASLLTLVLAAATLLVAAVDQVRQRRWPLAALAASGVPRATLARSVLWQNAIPVAVAVAIADLTGVVLAGLVLPVVGVDAVVDWRGVAVYSAAAVLAVGLVTLLTLPAVRQATRPTALRSE